MQWTFVNGDTWTSFHSMVSTYSNIGRKICIEIPTSTNSDESVEIRA